MMFKSAETHQLSRSVLFAADYSALTPFNPPYIFVVLCNLMLLWIKKQAGRLKFSDGLLAGERFVYCPLMVDADSATGPFGVVTASSGKGWAGKD